MNLTIAKTMAGVVLTGHGGLDKLEYRDDLPTPQPGRADVLIQVAAAGVNNTDINTRTAWYSKSVTSGTNAGGVAGFAESAAQDGSWLGAPLAFPRIQGADCCGRIVAVGEEVDPGRIGERVLVRALMGHKERGSISLQTYGSECDGGFAQYAVAPAREAYAVESDWSDVELASIPCAYSTAEGMLHRAAVDAGDTVLITGASGGVGSAAVQLAKRRGASVIAVASASKLDAISSIGADRVVARGESLPGALGGNSVDVVIDTVAGPQWPQLLSVLTTGGRYAVAGAIAGPIVDLDVRTLYLKDLSFFGCTYQERIVFENLLGYVERDEIKPLIAGTFPLADIVAAQQAFLQKQFIGKLVLIPPV